MTPTASISKPTQSDLRATIALIQRVLKRPEASKPVNKPVKLGYEKAIEILTEGQTTYDGIKDMRYQQSRAIAVLAVDYVNGEEKQGILIGVPLKA